MIGDEVPHQVTLMQSLQNSFNRVSIFGIILDFLILTEIVFQNSAM